MTIGAMKYMDRGISIGLVLLDGEKETIVYGEGREPELRQVLTEAFPGIQIFDRVYAFQKECERLGANPYPQAMHHKEPDPQKFVQWERVLWGTSPAVVANASLVAGRWVYQIIDQYDHKHTASESELNKTEQLPPEEEVVIDASYKAGEIVEWRGHKYYVISNNYISAKEAAELEDGFDAFSMEGYHCKLQLVHENKETGYQVGQVVKIRRASIGAATVCATVKEITNKCVKATLLHEGGTYEYENDDLLPATEDDITKAKTWHERNVSMLNPGPLSHIDVPADFEMLDEDGVRIEKKPWGGKRPGSGRKPGLTDAEKARREHEYQKFSFMSDLSDKEPICQLPTEAYCQTDKCYNMTNQGIWQMRNRIWSIRPICEVCIRVEGHADETD